MQITIPSAPWLTCIIIGRYLQILTTMKSSVGRSQINHEKLKSYFSSIMHWLFYYYTVHARRVHFPRKIKHHFLPLSIFSFDVKQSAMELINFNVIHKEKWTFIQYFFSLNRGMYIICCWNWKICFKKIKGFASLLITH